MTIGTWAGGHVGVRGAGYHFSEAVTYSSGLAPTRRLIKVIQIALVDLFGGFHAETWLARLQDFEDIIARAVAVCGKARQLESCRFYY